MFIWEFKQATKGRSRYDCRSLTNLDVKKEYFSSLKKCRKEVLQRVKEQGLSRDNWTQENWVKQDEYCVVNNSGGTGIFSFSRIEVK